MKKRAKSEVELEKEMNVNDTVKDELEKQRT